MTTGGETKSCRCAVRLAAGEDGNHALLNYLEREGLSDAARYAPKDDDELDVALCAGRFDRVVFADLDSLCAAVWKDHAHLDRWSAADVRIDLAVPPPAAADWRDICTEVFGSLARHRRRRRRVQIIAAVILSALALLAVAVLLWVIPPAR